MSAILHKRISLWKVLFALPVLWLVWTAWLYVSVPTERLRSSYRYFPIGSLTEREIGLAMPDILRMEDMSKYLVLAAFLSEDATFPDHPGYEISRIEINIRRYLSGKHPRLLGASTISQQIAKNLFTDGRRSWIRKYRELIYTIKLEQNFTKEELFTLYVNLVQTGDNLYGLKDAAQHYFKKAPADLTLVESAFLARLFPAPRRYGNWFEDKYFDKAFYKSLQSLVAYVMIREYEVAPFVPISIEQKNRIFSDYMRRTERFVCSTFPFRQTMRDKAALEVQRFVEQYLPSADIEPV